MMSIRSIGIGACWIIIFAALYSCSSMRVLGRCGKCSHPVSAKFWFNGFTKTIKSSSLGKTDSFWISDKEYYTYTPTDCYGTMTFRERYGEHKVEGSLVGANVLDNDFTISYDSVYWDSSMMKSIFVTPVDTVDQIKAFIPVPHGEWKFYEFNSGDLIRIYHWQMGELVRVEYL